MDPIGTRAAAAAHVLARAVIAGCSSSGSAKRAQALASDATATASSDTRAASTDAAAAPVMPASSEAAA